MGAMRVSLSTSHTRFDYKGSDLGRRPVEQGKKARGEKPAEGPQERMGRDSTRSPCPPTSCLVLLFSCTPPPLEKC